MERQSSVTICFGKKDADLLSWLALIPPHHFSLIVRGAIAAFIKDLPLDLGKVIIQPLLPPQRKSLVLSQDEPYLKRWINNIPRHLRSKIIKNILRRYIVFVIQKPLDGNYVPFFFPDREVGYYQFERGEALPAPIFITHSPPTSFNPEAEHQEFSLLYEMAAKSRFQKKETVEA